MLDAVLTIITVVVVSVCVWAVYKSFSINTTQRNC